MSAWQERFAVQYKRYVQSLLQPAGPGGLSPLDAEYNELVEIDYEMSDRPDEFKTGSLPINRSKNRNETVLPNEDTKIVLASLGPNDNTYVNANYIDGQTLFGIPFNYIATQAPLDSTVGDFWRMVGECGVRFIVCLTNDARTAKYWPRHELEILRPVASYQVQLVRVVHTDDVITRHVRLTNTDSRFSRDITIMQYVGWPDEGVPRSALGVMAIILTLGQLPESTLHPILVHCGAGVGRTGVFIAMHVCLSLFSMEKELNVKKIVQWLKYQRTGMVKTKLQYQFLVCALNREFQRMVLKHQKSYREQSALMDHSGGMGPLPELNGGESGRMSPLVAAPAGAFKDGRLDGSPSLTPSSPLRAFQSGGAPQQYPAAAASLHDPSTVYTSNGPNPVLSANVPPITRPEALPARSGHDAAPSGVHTSPRVRIPPDVAMYPTPAASATPPELQHPTTTTTTSGYGGPASPPPPAAPAPPPQPAQRIDPPNHFQQRLHGVVYGGPQPAAPPPASTPPPAQYSGVGALGKRSPNPPSTRLPPADGPGVGTPDGKQPANQRDVVLNMLQKLNNHTQKHRSVPPDAPRVSTYDLNTHSTTGRISPPRGGRVGGGYSDLNAAAFPSQPPAPTGAGAGLGGRAVRPPQEGVGKYGNEFERSMGLMPLTSSQSHFDT